MSTQPPIDAIVRAIVERIAPRRVVLFGSRARGDGDDDSDVDLMVELDGHADRHVRSERQGEIYTLFPNRDWSMDVLVCGADDVERQRDDPGTVMWDVTREGRVLYERPRRIPPGSIGAVTPKAQPNGDRVRERTPPPSLSWWVERAESDIRMIDIAIERGIAAGDSVRFLAHQVAERYLKALLIRHGLRPRRTHDLNGLLRDCRNAGYLLGGIDNDCRLLTPLAIEARCPADEFAAPMSASEADVKDAVAAMRQITEAARAEL
jgi:HEPN domain-containing protein/predicted nucleotidyltransferase